MQSPGGENVCQLFASADVPPMQLKYVACLFAAWTGVTVVLHLLHECQEPTQLEHLVLTPGARRWQPLVLSFCAGLPGTQWTT